MSDSDGQPYCFSALQRAENSSITGFPILSRPLFSFSALQRAENSSIRTGFPILSRPLFSFSALQRAENSSISLVGQYVYKPKEVSVLFSEPKIPQ